MKCSRGTGLFPLVLTGLLLLCVGAAEGQVKNRLIPFPEWASSSEEEDDETPLELVEVKVDGKSIILGQPFAADEAWLKNMTLRVRNISNKPIIAFGVGGGLLYGVEEELAPRASYAYGIGWQWGKTFDPEKEKPTGIALKPGEIAELSYANVDELTRKVLVEEGEGAFSKLKFMSPGVQYEDGIVALMPGMKFYGNGAP